MRGTLQKAFFSPHFTKSIRFRHLEDIFIRMKSRLTLNLHHGVGLNDAQLGGGHTGVVAGVADVAQLQDVLPDGKVGVRGEVPGALPPLDVGHGAAHRHAGDVQVGPVLHLVLCLRSDGEVRRDTAD